MFGAMKYISRNPFRTQPTAGVGEGLPPRGETVSGGPLRECRRTRGQPDSCHIWVLPRASSDIWKSHEEQGASGSVGSLSVLRVQPKDASKSAPTPRKGSRQSACHVAPHFLRGVPGGSAGHSVSPLSYVQKEGSCL